jgi:hypothetical protein
MDDPPSCDDGDYEHDGCFQQLSRSHAETRDDPQYANESKHEACSEYESEIDHARFESLHDGYGLPVVQR